MPLRADPLGRAAIAAADTAELGAGVSAKRQRSVDKVRQKDDDEEDDADNEEEDDVEDDDDDERQLDAVRKTQLHNADAIVAAFIACTFVAKHTSSKLSPEGRLSRHYIIRGVAEGYDVTQHVEDSAAWPRCLNIEDTLVSGAMIEVTDPKAPRLVGLWAFSIGGDETVEYDLMEAKTEVRSPGTERASASSRPVFANLQRAPHASPHLKPLTRSPELA